MLSASITQIRQALLDVLSVLSTACATIHTSALSTAAASSATGTSGISTGTSGGVSTSITGSGTSATNSTGFSGSVRSALFESIGFLRSQEGRRLKSLCISILKVQKRSSGGYWVTIKIGLK
jgi:hypothetical protein